MVLNSSVHQMPICLFQAERAFSCNFMISTNNWLSRQRMENLSKHTYTQKNLILCTLQNVHLFFEKIGCPRALRKKHPVLQWWPAIYCRDRNSCSELTSVQYHPVRDVVCLVKFYTVAQQVNDTSSLNSGFQRNRRE